MQDLASSSPRMNWLQHAFAVPSASDFQPTDEERALIARLQTELARRRLQLPACVLLESFRPLGFVMSQAVWATTPWLAALTDAAGLKLLGTLLERPGGIDYVIEALSRDPTRERCEDSTRDVDASQRSPVGSQLNQND